ncbi:hypothetical protein [Bradyrhizobium aeschynomenes]|uniref:hypothetical protein n=1 Tax=Bradyrhizobium aeschynomenes TaxID=2734909 RepID=UPI0015546E88|nr:hypothetical protein [Bradyrhizobium aeschynomenes]
MAARHSFTFQINPGLPGHAAVVVNDPAGQVYAGFGPEHHGSISDKGSFNAHSMQNGKAPPNDFSSVVDDGQYATFTVPITERQAGFARREIEKLKAESLWYSGWDLARLSRDPRICTTIVNRITEAAGLGKHLYPIPQANYEYLSDIADTLAKDPKAQRLARTGLPVPEALRGIQKDYAYVGGGADTPSERLGRFPSGANGGERTEPASSFDARFGDWIDETAGATPPERGESGSIVEERQPVRRLRSRRVSSGAQSVFETGAPPVPFLFDRD